MVLLAAAASLLGCGEKTGPGATGGPGSAAPMVTGGPGSAAPGATGGPGSAAPGATDATAAAPGSAAAVGTATDTETDAPGPEPTKKYDCGAKTQKPCPMQGWMKKVMAPASSSGDGAKLAEALEYVAKKPPPGYAEWTAIAKAGAAKAKAGDVDAAKASCKKCHDAYKADYKAKSRDRPW
jgi:hypothetical protein